MAGGWGGFKFRIAFEPEAETLNPESPTLYQKS